MLKPKLLVASVLVLVLLSGILFSLVAAQEDPATPDRTVIPDQTQVDPTDGSTVTQDGDWTTFSTDDNSTEPQREPAPDVPGAEDANLIATQTGADNTLPILAGAVVIAVVVCAVGVFGWRKKLAKA